MKTLLLATGLMIGSHLLSGCLGGSTPTSIADNRDTQASETRQNVFDASNFTPLPAASKATAELRAIREKILGPDAMNPEVVKVWWVGVSSFIVSMKGHLFLLDAWEIVGAHANYVPIRREELAAIKPEAIFIGHGHFDHAASAGDPTHAFSSRPDRSS